MIEALRNKRHNGRVFVVRTLGLLGPEAAPAVPNLIAVLGEHRTEVQHDAAIALRAIGPAAAEALPALRRLQQEARSGVGSDLNASISDSGEALHNIGIPLHEIDQERGLCVRLRSTLLPIFERPGVCA